MRDHVPVAVKDTDERSSLETAVHGISIRRNDGLVEDLAAGEVGVQVDIINEDEVLVIIQGVIAQSDQIGYRGDLVGVVRLSRPAAVFRLCRCDEQTRDQRQKDGSRNLGSPNAKATGNRF